MAAFVAAAASSLFLDASTKAATAVSTLSRGKSNWSASVSSATSFTSQAAASAADASEGAPQDAPQDVPQAAPQASAVESSLADAPGEDGEAAVAHWALPLRDDVNWPGHVREPGQRRRAAARGAPAP